jgi:hypothetical protein
MEYLSLKEAIEYTGKSESTLRGVVRGLKGQENQLFEGSQVLKFDTLVNRSKKIFILKAYLNDLYKIEPIKTTYQDNRSSDSLNDRYIDRLEKELDNKQKEIDNFLELEAQIIDRFKELQEALKRTQYQLQQQTELTAKKDAELKKIEQKLTPKKEDSIHNIEDVKSEEVKLSDEPEPSLEKLNKHRQDILKDILTKGEAEAEARRKRIRERNNN